MRNSYKYKSAHTFFEDVIRVSAGDGPDVEMVYRGLGDANYKIIPSSMRDDSCLQFLHLEGDATAIRIASEPYRIFYQTVNRRGYYLPSVSLDKHQDYVNNGGVAALLQFADEADKVYDLEDLEIMAFAQHYGLPTPLIDWSRSPLVAMYFSACDALKKIVTRIESSSTVEKRNFEELTFEQKSSLSDWYSDKFISVWRADSQAIVELVRNKETWDRTGKPGYSLRFLTPRMQGNENIVAQQGLFSIHHPVPITLDFKHGVGQVKCFSEVVDEYTAWNSESGNISNYIKECLERGVLHEFLLPYSEVPGLIRILDRCGINAASIFPGHRGCAEIVRERAALALAISFGVPSDLSPDND